MRRATRTFVSARSRLAAAKRRCSWGSRRYARMTRMPVSPSRVTRLSVSILRCSERMRGMATRMTASESAMSTGMAQKMTTESWTLMESAASDAPTSMMGDIMAMVIVICEKRSSCWTSLVVRVMSDDVPKASVSPRENELTRP